MLNRATLIGRLGKDPIMRKTKTGVALCDFSLATSEKFRQGGELVEVTEWHKVVLWRKQAETAVDMLHKGDLVYVEGKVHYDSFDNAEGQKVNTTSIQALFFKVLNSKHWQKAPAPTSDTAASFAEGGDDDDDTPF